MKDKDVSKMLLKLLNQQIGTPPRGGPVFPNFSNMGVPQKKRPAPTRAQLEALKEGRKVLLMKHQSSQKSQK